MESILIVENNGSDNINSNPTEAKRASSFVACYVNMTNTVCGAGVLGLSYAFSKTDRKSVV